MAYLVRLQQVEFRAWELIQLGNWRGTKSQNPINIHSLCTWGLVSLLIQNSSILQKLKQQNDAFKEEDKKRNLEYLGTLFKTAIYMLYKRWAITDNLSDMTELLGNELNYKHVADHLVHHPTITYTSPSSVQEIVASLSFSIESELLESIREAGWYSLLADESADDANREQLAIIIRFIDPNGGHIRKVFLGLLKLMH